MPDPMENSNPDQMVNDPSSQLFASLADFYRDNGLIPEAIAICQAGLESQPDNMEGRLVMARCLLATKQYAQARTEAVKVLSVQSENAEAKKILAQADSAVPEVPEAAASPAKAEKPAAPLPGTAQSTGLVQSPEPPAPAKEPVKPVHLETVPKDEIPVPAPVKIPDVPVRGIPPNPLPLMAKRSDPPLVPPHVPNSIPDQPMEITAAASRPVQLQVPAAPAATAIPAAPVRPSKPVAEEGAEWQAGFGKIMGDLVQTPQVKACMLVDEAGYLVADAVSRIGQNLSDDTAALSANIFKTASQALQKIKLGLLERIVIETGDEKIFLRQAGKMVLVISADSSAKVGLVMVNSRRAAEQAENLAKRESNR